jgi:hypothetical protein
LVGHYARLRHRRQRGEFLTTGGAIDPMINRQIGGRCSTSAVGRSATVKSVRELPDRRRSQYDPLRSLARR